MVSFFPTIALRELNNSLRLSSLLLNKLITFLIFSLNFSVLSFLSRNAPIFNVDFKISLIDFIDFSALTKSISFNTDRAVFNFSYIFFNSSQSIFSKDLISSGKLLDPVISLAIFTSGKFSRFIKPSSIQESVLFILLKISVTVS